MRGYLFKVAVITRGLLISTVIDITGFNASIAVEEASDAVKNGIVVGFTIIPASPLVVGFLIITYGYHIKESDIETYSAEIKARKQS